MHRNKSPSFKERDRQFREVCQQALDLIATSGHVTTIRLEEHAKVKRSYASRVLHFLRVEKKVSATKANGSVPIQYMTYDPATDTQEVKRQGRVYSKWMDEMSDQVQPEKRVKPQHCEIHQAFFSGRQP